MTQFSKPKALLITSAKYFRLGMEAAASDVLAQSIDQLIPMFGFLPEDKIARLNEVLTTTFAAQARKDFLFVADLLEYEIVILLND